MTNLGFSITDVLAGLFAGLAFLYTVKDAAEHDQPWRWLVPVGLVVVTVVALTAARSL